MRSVMKKAELKNDILTAAREDLESPSGLYDSESPSK